MAARQIRHWRRHGDTDGWLEWIVVRPLHVQKPTPEWRQWQKNRPNGFGNLGRADISRDSDARVSAVQRARPAIPGSRASQKCLPARLNSAEECQAEHKADVVRRAEEAGRAHVAIVCALPDSLAVTAEFTSPPRIRTANERSFRRSVPHRTQALPCSPSVHCERQSDAPRPDRREVRAANAKRPSMSVTAAPTGFAARFTCALAQEHFAPPLQPDFARHRFSCKIAHARNFGVERIKRKQCFAPVGWSEQGREIAVAIGFAHVICAICERLFHSANLRVVQVTAMRPAPTRRFSAKRML